VLCKKKRSDHAWEEGEESEQINFAWIVCIGLQMGYRESEIAHMYFGKWCDLFTEYKKIHNIRMQRMIFEEKKITSMLDL
jgi:hypothetical protein